MFNGLKIQTNSSRFLSLVGGATIAAATLVLTGSILPASAASITYSTWANIGPVTVGDKDNGNFSLKITGGADSAVGQAGQVLFQFTSSLADGIYIPSVYFYDNAGLFKKTGNEYNASVSTTFSDAVANTSSYSGLSFYYDNNTNLPQGSSITLTNGSSLGKASFGFNKSGGNKNTISGGETLGILVDLATDKSFTDVLNSLTKNSDFIVAAHLTGYSGKDASDTFYYGNPYTTTPGTDSAIFYDSYKTPTDPNPATKTTALAPGTAVPEPLTILGAATAAGFGAFFKRRLAKLKDNQQS
jgi:hypothetical protein